MLPTTKTIKQENLGPKLFIMYGLPKVGKTTILSKLPNALHLDLEDGTNYIDGYIIKIKTYIDLFETAKSLRTEKHDFKFVIIDTITALEEIALPFANKLYRDTPMGVNFDEKKSVLTLPNGAGHLYVREAINIIIKWFMDSVEYVILTGHVKDSYLTTCGQEIAIKQLDLTGKTGNILSAKSDSIGYLYRTSEEIDKLRINFKADGVLCGSRNKNLSDKNFIISEFDENGNLQTHWDLIYPFLEKQNK